MNRTVTILSAALATLLGVGVSTAEASKGPVHGAARARGHAARHHHAHAHLHAHAFRHSFHRGHTGWTRYAWLPKQRVYGYYAPARGWYYWHASSNLFLPIAYLGTYVPKPTNGMVIIAPNKLVESSPELPAGAVELPAGVKAPVPE